MYVSKIKPTGVERPLALDAVILSKTDLRGVITYCNDLFVEYSGYSYEELYGAPHSIIRHPGMPRGAFKFLWQEIQAGREVFLFVKNLARNGSHYWVIAQIIPEVVNETVIGYLSFRRCPSRRGVEMMEALYNNMLEIEEKISGNAGMDASCEMLVHTLKAMGKSYDALVYEVPSRG
jgi:PAS domain S-box-containing protein